MNNTLQNKNLHVFNLEAKIQVIKDCMKATNSKKELSLLKASLYACQKQQKEENFLDLAELTFADIKDVITDVKALNTINGLFFTRDNGEHSPYINFNKIINHLKSVYPPKADELPGKYNARIKNLAIIEFCKYIPGLNPINCILTTSKIREAKYGTWYDQMEYELDLYTSCNEENKSNEDIE